MADSSSRHDCTELANRVASDVTYDVVIKFEVFVYVLRHANGSMHVTLACRNKKTLACSYVVYVTISVIIPALIVVAYLCKRGAHTRSTFTKSTLTKSTQLL